ncbi:DUF309 domain-containing protein [Streptomyces sp. NPDC002790]|uniref:DUF309 domain-containing protein n=1 Tax=Streptomyces sp. NPDC002790 TaxID=3154431 RepID=UPI003333E746
MSTSRDGERDRDQEGRARNARPRDGLGRPLPYGKPGVERQPEGVVRTAAQSVAEAQALLDSGRPFHAHEVFEDAWKSGPEGERGLWRALAQTAVGLTHAARGNATGGARLLRRGAEGIAAWQGVAPAGLDTAALVRWAQGLADEVERSGGPVDAASVAPHLT